jgi:hypothetical protein
MKKAIGTFLIIIVTFYITGCKKIFDQVDKDPGQEFTYCDIKKLKVWFNDSYNEFNVIYNNKGQPKDVLGINPDTPLTKFSFDQHFRYDKKGRLTDWILNPPGQKQVWLWDTYRYLSDKKVVDTTYAPYNYGNPFSFISDQHPPYGGGFPMRVRIFDYDEYGRVVKMTWDNSVHVYEYDTRGNSTDYPGNVYDSGVNIVRTNKIWMFVNNNYNVNNYTVNYYGTNVLTYNSYMLPTTIELIPGWGHDGEQFMTAFIFNKMVVEYDCKGNPKFY